MLAVLLAACVHKGPASIPEPAELDAILARATSRSIPTPGLHASFHIDVNWQGKSGSTIGALILHPPDDLRIEIQTPLRTPLLLAATDGTSIDAYVANGNQYLRGDDAVATLEAFAGGAMHPTDLLALLVGIPPLHGAALVSKEPVPGGVRAIYDGPAGTTIKLEVDAETGALRSFEADHGDTTLFVVTYGLPTKGDPFPKRLELHSPVLGLRLDFQHWDELTAVPDVFSLEPPPGSVERDLLEVLHTLDRAP
jgi:hypothetical protein